MKNATAFRCTECDYRAAKWLGRCPECDAWNSLAPAAGEAPPRTAGPRVEPIPFDAISRDDAPRILTGISEFDRVLGGGVVPGSLVLIGGNPGIGKSTLLLQGAARLAASLGTVLYVSGEESAAQVRMRGERLGVRSSGLLFLPETALARVLEAVADTAPAALIIDSIQTVHSDTLPSAPGSLAQVREAAARLLQLAKGRGIPIFVVGHVTKDGALAGPRALEHIVDTVLYFEGERHHAHRILRAEKNRFGPTNEIGIFEMTGAGLQTVEDPSRLFLGEGSTRGPGSVVLPTLEGTRTLLVELQALVAEAGAGQGRRVALGIDPGRLALLVAVLERETGLPLAGRDIYVNVAGGFELHDPGADLATVCALASSLRGAPLPADAVIFGEVGLTGEVRAVGRAAERLGEARRLGFRGGFFPRANASAATGLPHPCPVSTLREALAALRLGPGAAAGPRDPAAGRVTGGNPL